MAGKVGLLQQLSAKSDEFNSSSLTTSLHVKDHHCCIQCTVTKGNESFAILQALYQGIG